ncbi:MAG: hypothetical protein K8T10_21860 [Candidatus Eremiobacteraeota bacterium]|nr:hypothetical protein [Candidatus Eremiobacteraeota bacterium]
MMDSSIPGSSNIGKVFRKIAHQMQELFSETLQLVEHPLEVGLARERLLIEYLKRFLPERFGIDTGFVIDSKNNMSKQIDVIIYDKIISPVFEIPGGVKYFPCECVVAVGEVKTSINSRKTLQDALNKIQSVQELDRFSSGKNTEMAFHGAHGHGKEINIGRFGFLPSSLPPIGMRTLGFIFTSQSMSRGTMLNELKDYCASSHKQYWPNIIVDFENYLISYFNFVVSNQSTRALASEPDLFPDKADGFYYTTEAEKKNIVLLFACLLINFLTVVRVVRPFVLDYFGMRMTQKNIYPFNTAEVDIQMGEEEKYDSH